MGGLGGGAPKEKGKLHFAHERTTKNPNISGASPRFNMNEEAAEGLKFQERDLGRKDNDLWEYHRAIGYQSFAKT